MPSKTISIIATGGAIASKETEKGLKPTYKLIEMVNEIPQINDIANIRSIQLMNKDSSNVIPEDWIKIAAAVSKELEFSDGVVITHGTDTMTYTASALSFMLNNLQKPVILTGSQRPWDEENSDAKTNLTDAVKAAEAGNGKSIEGVNIVFNGKIIKGCRARKTKHNETAGYDAFETVNFPLVGIMNNKHVMANPLLEMTNGVNGEFKLDTKIDKGVFMLTLAPGLNPRIMEKVKDEFNGIIIQAYGMGDMPIHGNADLIPMVKNLMDNGKIVAVASQSCFNTDLSRYEVGREFLNLGVIPTLDMTPECAYTKLMWSMGHTRDTQEIKKIMWNNYAGELWPVDGNPRGIVKDMAKMHDLTKILFDSNHELIRVLGNFSKD